jgi:polysaccharide biosynthesis protein VpsQ
LRIWINPNSQYLPFPSRLINDCYTLRIKAATAVYVLIVAGITATADLLGTSFILKLVGNIPYGDKIGHLLLMGTLSLLINLSLCCRTFKKILLASVFVFAAVALEEFSKLWVEGRTFDLFDLLFDLIGIFAFGQFAKVACSRGCMKMPEG